VNLTNRFVDIIMMAMADPDDSSSAGPSARDSGDFSGRRPPRDQGCEEGEAGGAEDSAS